MRMPAEWEPHAATWLAWPHNEDTWPACLDQVRESFAEMIRLIAEKEQVDLLVQSVDAEANAREALVRSGVALDAIRFHVVRTNDSWIRDFGPIFVNDQKGLLALNWRFNAWGEKYSPWYADDAAAAIVGELAGCKTLSMPTVLEGGAIDVDGAGNLLTTSQNVYAAKRGPSRGDEVFGTVSGPLGIHQIFMLGNGIAGDDTDGHVDDVARFVPNQTIVAATEVDRGDVNYESLTENIETLCRHASTTGHRIVELPMPDPVTCGKGQRLPASYANFYICNAAVLVPTFAQSKDQIAIDILQSLFDDRPVVGVNAQSLVVGLGACHCLTMQQPAV